MGLRQKITLIFLTLSFCARAFAEKTLDNALRLAGADIARMCGVKDILVIDDFASPSAKMTEYIREQLGDLIYAQDGLVRIVTRDKLSQQMTERERRFQNSGVVDESTILSVAKRLGARNVVFGAFEELKSGYMLRVRMLAVESDAYIFRKTYEFPRSAKTEQFLGRADIYYRASAGAGVEVSKNSLEFIAPAASASFDYALARKIVLGARIVMSYDVHEKDNSLFSMETLASARFYLVSPSGEPVTGLFVEALIGASILFVNSEATGCLNFGGASGFRKTFGSIYLEPALRFGYPYMFGASLSAGLRF